MLDKLEMFIAVARKGHFGRAALSLGITQPTLSSGIKQLEEQLGVQLIFRGSRFGGLTPEGQSALDWARRIVGDARQLKEEMQARRHGLSGRLRIAVIPTALTWAARLSARFSQRHPNVRFTILSRPSTEIFGMLDNLDLEELSVACREEGRYRFRLTVAPLNVPRGTGGPVNPVAVF